MVEFFNMEFEFRRNNFDLIRLLASFQVMLFHGIDHLGLTGGYLDYLRIFPGVPIFFVISGYLISASYETSQNNLNYFKNRCLRIYPALWVCLLISLLMLILMDQLNVKVSTLVIWLASQITFFQFYNHGIFSEYGTGVVNGSLWTISVELQFYFILPLLYWFYNKYKPSKSILIFLFLIFVIIKQIHNMLHFNKLPEEHPSIWMEMVSVSLPTYLYYFIIGIFFQQNIELIKKFLRGKVVFYLFLYLLWTYIASRMNIMSFDNYINPVSGLLLALFVISFAYSNVNLSTFLKGNDVSYGIYIYHMLVINFLVEIGFVTRWDFLLAAVIATTILAFLSWRYVEKPALKLKKYSILSLSKTGQSQVRHCEETNLGAIASESEAIQALLPLNKGHERLNV